MWDRKKQKKEEKKTKPNKTKQNDINFSPLSFRARKHGGTHHRETFHILLHDMGSRNFIQNFGESPEFV